MPTVRLYKSIHTPQKFHKKESDDDEEDIEDDEDDIEDDEDDEEEKE